MSLGSAPSHDGTLALMVRGLTKTYAQGRSEPVKAVNDVSLAIPSGQVFGLLGPNGAGKTTLIKMICGLVTPTAGTVMVHGQDLLRRRSAAVRHLGAVLEGGRNVYWSMSAWQNLIYFGRLRGLRAQDISVRAEWLLRELELWDRRHQLVGGFSRGMQQKVAVAAALVSDPHVVLLDEPTLGLDIEAARTVRDWIRRLAHDHGKTVVLTTHQLAMANQVCDRIAVIRRGQIVADLPVGQLLNLYREDAYEVRVAEEPEALAGALPRGARLSYEDGTTRVVLTDSSQDDLYGLLASFQQRRVRLLSVGQLQPDLEDVFLRLVKDA